MVSWIVENAGTLIAILSGLAAVAWLIVRLTPNKKDDSVLQSILNVLAYLPGFKRPAGSTESTKSAPVEGSERPLIEKRTKGEDGSRGEKL